MGKCECGIMEPKRSPRLLSDQLLGEELCEEIKEFVKCLIIPIVWTDFRLAWNRLSSPLRGLLADWRYGVIV